MNRKLAQHLENRIRGRVLSEPGDLRKFSRDQSIYEIIPEAAVIPADYRDIATVLELAREEGITVHPRGGGSGTAGAALGRGIVLAPEPDGPLGSITTPVDSSEGLFVRVGAAAVHDTLQLKLADFGHTLPADPSSGMVSLIGGNVATRASGAHSLKWGAIDHFLYGIEFFLPDGRLVDSANPATIPPELRRELDTLRLELAVLPGMTQKISIRHGMKTSSGYNLSALLEDTDEKTRLARLLAGSVGTLGIITAVTLKGVPRQEGRCLVMIPFRQIGEAADVVCWLNKTGAAAVELISADTMKVIRKLHSGTFPVPVDAHLLFIELAGPDRHQQLEQIQIFFSHDCYPLDYRPVIARDEGEIDRLWTIRKRLQPLLCNHGPGRAALALVNDIGIPPTCLASLVEALDGIFSEYGLPSLIYGHAGSGNLHLRPVFDLTDPQLQRKMSEVAEKVYSAVLGLGGTVSGEHGMGRLHAPWLAREWGDPVMQRMRRLKTLFDPDGILNPEAMFFDGPVTDSLRPEFRGPGQR